MKVIVTMAGAGARLKDFSHIPKPLITVGNDTILGHSLATFPYCNSTDDLEFIYVIRKSHEEAYRVSDYVSSIPKFHSYHLVEDTKGQADTLYQVLRLFDRDEEFMVLCADNYIDMDFPKYRDNAHNFDVYLTTFIEDKFSNKFAYATFEGDTLRIYEKLCPSDDAMALAGLFYFKSVGDFQDYYEMLVDSGATIHKEHYISAVVDLMSQEGKNVGRFLTQGMWSLGSKEEIQEFLDA